MAKEAEWSLQRAEGRVLTGWQGKVPVPWSKGHRSGLEERMRVDFKRL